MPDDYKIKFTTEADTSGVEQQKQAVRELTAETKKAEQEAAAAAKAAAKEQQQAAKEAADEAEAAVERQIKEAQKLAKELQKVAEERERAAASEARSLDGFSRSGGSQSSAAAWAEEASRVFGDFGTQARGAQGATDELGGGLVALGGRALAVVGGFTALQQAVSASLAEFAEEELAVLQLSAAMQTAGVASEGYQQKLMGLADSLEDAVSNVSGEQWLAVLTQLTQAGADSTEIDDLAEGVKNLAGIMGGNVQGASAVFARALRGNFEALSQFGVRMDESATHAQKMAALMEIAGQGAGVLEARANTLTGGSERLAKAWGDVKKGLGEAIAPAAKGAMDALAAALRGVTSLFPKAEEETKDFAAAQNKLKAETDQATQSLDRQRAVLAGMSRQVEGMANNYERIRRAQQGAQSRADEISDAKATREEAKIDAFEKAGRYTPEQAAAAKDIVRNRYEKEKFDRAQKGRQDEIASRTEESNRLEHEAMKASKQAQSTGDDKDIEEADRITQMFVERARENAARIEELKNEIEQQNELFNLKQDTRGIQAKGEILGSARKKREEAAEASKKQTPSKPDKLAGDRADAVAEAQGIGSDLEGLKGPSPEVTGRLQAAAQSLADGGSTEELSALNGVLDKLATSLEKRGKGEEAKLYRELQGRVSRLEGVVRRLESQQGGSGS